MATKSFKDNPALNFISQESIEAVDGEEDRAAESAVCRKKVPPDKPGHLTIDRPEVEPKKYPNMRRERPANAPEAKTRRLQSLVRPSTYETLKEIAFEEGISANEALNRALEEYIAKRRG